MENPKISIITVCYNAVNTINKTILSVTSQTYRNIEYIIVDGASTDGTVNIIKMYGKKVARWVSEPDKGIYDAMNKGIRYATGDYINFMNAGDTFYSERSVAEAVKLIDEDTVVAYGNTMLLYSFGTKLKEPDPLDRITKGMVFGHQSTFVRTSYHKAHLFDISFRSSGDYKFFYDTYFAGVKFQYIPVTVAIYQAEGGMSSSNSGIIKKEDARVRGIDNTIQWKIAYFIDRMNMGIRGILKKILPHNIVESIRYRNYKRL